MLFTLPPPEVLLDRLMRLQAEYENYRKRVTREKREWTGRAVEALVLVAKLVGQLRGGGAAQ